MTNPPQAATGTPRVHLHYERDIPLSEANMLIDYINRLERELSQARNEALEEVAVMHDEAAARHHLAADYTMAGYEGAWANTVRTAKREGT